MRLGRSPVVEREERGKRWSGGVGSRGANELKEKRKARANAVDDGDKDISTSISSLLPLNAPCSRAARRRASGPSRAATCAALRLPREHRRRRTSAGAARTRVPRPGSRAPPTTTTTPTPRRNPKKKRKQQGSRRTASSGPRGQEPRRPERRGGTWFWVFGRCGRRRKWGKGRVSELE